MITAAATVGPVAGNVPTGLTRTNGSGLPVAFVLAAVIGLRFFVGYAAKDGQEVNSGAFHAQAARALGKPAAATSRGWPVRSASPSGSGTREPSATARNCAAGRPW
ncbi:hypothetical protein [Paeniglutamicibacter cryotolerans]|uniref:Uncharacterized protein n=1 Tax=Paeniglutamicibacter cryotolerans TaxID=670079 RepID=A0A839QKV2_9MICC|nr:hypothetical protein [Paeniglutamicibacter cryotolerans]MBB2996243.1 hypothetical protein [Paeniglutamicibacter cryotolerans]